MKDWLEDLNKTLGLGLILAVIVFLIRGYYGILDEIRITVTQNYGDSALNSA